MYSKFSRENKKIKERQTKSINGFGFKGLVHTEADVTVISRKFFLHPD